jgi:hypothetical protein
MNPFAKLNTEGMETPEDSLGPSFDAVPSDAYDAIIKNMYAIASAGGAQGVVVIADLNGTELRETQWVTNKKGENFYLSKDDKKTKIPLPGYTTIDDICLLTTGESLSDQNFEKKMVKVYNPEEKKELPTEVPVIIDAIGKPIKLGVLREITFKQKKGDDGNYHDTEDTRTQNVINKVFHHETGRTVNEYRHEVEDAEFLSAWLDRNQGKDRDKTKNGSGGGGAGSSGSGKPGGDKASPKKKLFG